MPTFQIFSNGYDLDSGFPFEVPELTYDNYFHWSWCIGTVLESEGLKGLVEGSETAPTSSGIDDFKKRQRRTVLLIRMCIPDFKRYSYGADDNEVDPKVLWDKIAEGYRRTLHPWHIRRELYNMRLEDFDSVAFYTIEIDSLVQKYNFAVGNSEGRQITKEEHIFFYVNGLPESWREAQIAWEIRGDSEELIRNPRKLMIAMREREGHLEFMRMRKDQERKIKCFKCGHKGHRKIDCPN